MKIIGVKANNGKRVFEVLTVKGEYSFPYAKLVAQPTRVDRVREVYPDPEVGGEAFTYRLESGVEDTVHLDVVLEYNQDPALLNDLLLFRLSVETREAVEESGLSKREMPWCMARRQGQIPPPPSGLTPLCSCPASPDRSSY